MKWLKSILLIVLCTVLLIFSKTAQDAAKDALILCAARVIPALFPFYVAVTLLCEGLMSGNASLRTDQKRAGILCWVLGAISGYPAGARICCLAGRTDLAAVCNLCSPVFIIGVVASGFLEDAKTALPIMLAHYVASILTYAVHRITAQTSVPDAAHGSASSYDANSLTTIIANGVTAMARITGCIVLFSVCSALLHAVFNTGGLFGALLSGLLEMTIGCQEIAKLAIFSQLKIAWIAGMISFGGCSVLMQAVSVAQIRNWWSYLASKAFQGCCAFWIAYLLAPLFCPDIAETFTVTGEQMIANTAVLASISLAASAGMIFAYLFGRMMQKARHITVPGCNDS